MRKILVIISFLSVLFACEKEEDIPQFIQAEITGYVANNNYQIGDSIYVYIDYKIKSDCYNFSYLKTEKLDDKEYKFEVWLEYNNNECSENITTGTTIFSLPTDSEGDFHFIFNNEENYYESWVNVSYPETNYKLVAEDYQYIVDSVLNDPEKYMYVDMYQTGEIYYGADSYYKIFDFRTSRRINSGLPSYTGLSESEIETIMWERLPEALIFLLKHKYANSNINEHLKLIFEIYDDSYVTNNYNITFKCTDKNPNLSFEIIDGPNIQ